MFAQKNALGGLLCIVTLCSAINVHAGGGNKFSRQFQPLVISGSTFPQFAGADITSQGNQLYLYAFDASQTKWEQIPFQFDEVDPDSGSYFEPDDGVLDDNDELVFMPCDGGDQAFIWIDDEDSQKYIRYEIKVSDPLNPGSETFVYLYRSSTIRLDPNLTDYVGYFPSVVGADTIRSKFYELANNATGFANDLRLISKSTSNLEIFDRLKFKATGSVFGLGFTVNENGISIDSVDVIDGLVRVIRRQDAQLTVDVSIIGKQTLPFSIPPAIFNPYSACLSVGIPDISSLSGQVDFARMSIDLNSNANGSKFVSANNPEPGFTIDGSMTEKPNFEIDTVLPDNNWQYINGEFGTLVHLFPFPTSVGDNRALFYKDDTTIDPEDTGDQLAYGDTGIEIKENVTPPFNFVYKGYFLNDTSLPSTIGSDIAAWERTPMTVDAKEQDLGSVPVELVSFTASVTGEDVQLSWITASETNNFGFDIERKQADVEWVKIGFKAGNGTVTEPVQYGFVDENLPPGTYSYRLKQIDTDGAFEYSGTISVVIGLPEDFVLHQNYPNPFNPSTTIVYEIPAISSAQFNRPTTVAVYDLLGNRIRILVNEEKAPGRYEVVWDGRDDGGAIVSSGVYIYRLRAGDFITSKKMLLLQ